MRTLVLGLSALASTVVERKPIQEPIAPILFIAQASGFTGAEAFSYPPPSRAQIIVIGVTLWALPTEIRTMEQNSPSPYPRALIVEDETMIALGLEAHLRELGFQACDLAADGHQALSHAVSNPPNVVLMDVNLEGNREGIEVARKLRETCDVPIVFVTGCTDSETIQLLRSEVPGAPVLPKPIWNDRLADAVDAVMKFRMW